LRAALPREDVFTCFGEDVRDRFGQGDWHGTGSAGLALYGERLADALVSMGPWRHTHHLESVKYIPSAGQNDPDQLTEYASAYLKELHEGPDPRFTGC